MSCHGSQRHEEQDAPRDLPSPRQPNDSRRILSRPTRRSRSTPAVPRAASRSPTAAIGRCRSARTAISSKRIDTCRSSAPAAYGMRLNIAAGTAVRFEPGDTREVELVAIGGRREVYGLNGLVNGALDDEAVRERALEAVEDFRVHDANADESTTETRTHRGHDDAARGRRTRRWHLQWTFVVTPRFRDLVISVVAVERLGNEARSPHLRRPLRPDDRRSRPPGRYRSRHPDRARLRPSTATRRSSAAAR